MKWIEEPLKASDEIHLAELKTMTSTPIAGCENLPIIPNSDVESILNEPFDILQPDLTKNAPLHIARQLLGPGKPSMKRIIPHFLGSAPGQVASLHFAAGCPDNLVEMDLNHNPLRSDLFTEPIQIVDGEIAIPSRPGLGWQLRYE